jgi:hypothetical protein
VSYFEFSSSYFLLFVTKKNGIRANIMRDTSMAGAEN